VSENECKPSNILYYGDNLDVLRRHVKDESVELVYLDPPFNSNQNYNVLFAEQNGSRAAAQIKAFEDSWRWDQESARAYEETVESGGRVSDVLRAFRVFLGESDMMAYLAMMAPRLSELRRILKSTGSIYLHCDPTASHYLKLLMDAIFGPQNFRNELIWVRTNARSTAGQFPRLHDVILFYSKSDSYTYHSVRVSAEPGRMPHTLITGPDGLKYQTYELTAPGMTRDGDSGKPWRGHDPSAMGRHWANTSRVMDEWDDRGLIHWPKGGGFPRRRAAEPFSHATRQTVVGDVWTDIDRLNQTAKERLGYPTQKPVSLLERILEASSAPNETVLDPFCGCGTTIAAAQALGRCWIGVDITHLAITLIRHRLRDSFGTDVEKTYRVVGEPVSVPDALVLAEQDPYQFQWWALGLVNARPVEQKKGADKGVDGRLYFHDDPRDTRTKQIILSVKSGHVTAAHLRDLRGVVEREKAEIGVLISMREFTALMRKEAASAGFYHSETWNRDHPRLQLLTIADLLEGKGIDYPPSRQVDRTFKKAPKPKTKRGETPKLPF